MGLQEHRGYVENRAGYLSGVHNPGFLMEETLFLNAGDIVWCHTVNNACFPLPSLTPETV